MASAARAPPPPPSRLGAISPSACAVLARQACDSQPALLRRPRLQRQNLPRWLRQVNAAAAAAAAAADAADADAAASAIAAGSRLWTSVHPASLLPSPHEPAHLLLLRSIGAVGNTGCNCGAAYKGELKIACQVG